MYVCMQRAIRQTRAHQLIVHVHCGKDSHCWPCFNSKYSSPKDAARIHSIEQAARKKRKGKASVQVSTDSKIEGQAYSLLARTTNFSSYSQLYNSVATVHVVVRVASCSGKTRSRRTEDDSCMHATVLIPWSLQ